jgi:excisionase family DNA binding protein
MLLNVARRISLSNQCLACLLYIRSVYLGYYTAWLRFAEVMLHKCGLRRPGMHPELLKAREVARCLGVHVRTVWKWTAEGELPPPIRVGRVTRWRRRDVEAYQDARQCRLPPRRPA